MQKNQKLKIQPNNLVKNWRKVKLGETFIISREFGRKIKVSEYKTEGKIPIYDQGNAEISGYTDDISSIYKGKLPAILFGDHTLKLRIINHSFSIGADGIQILEPSKKIFDKVFFFYCLKFVISKLLKSYGYERHLKYLREIEVIIPEDINEQKRISSIFSAFDDKIELNNKINETLEEMAQAIFKHWFVDFKFPGHEKAKSRSERSSTTGIKFVNSELGKIPEGWEVKRFEDIMEFLSGKKPPELIFNPSGEYFIYGSNTVMGKSNEFLYKGPLVILARIGSSCGALRLSIAPCWISNNTTGIKGKNNISTFFVYLLLKRFDFNQIKEGTGQPYINVKALKSYKVVIPPSKILNTFDKIIRNFYYQIQEKAEENQKLAELRDLLLPKLMGGEVRV